MDLRALSVGHAAIIFAMVLVARGFSDTLSPVGAAEGCDLLILIFHFRLNCVGQDRSLVALDSSYTAPTAQRGSIPRRYFCSLCGVTRNTSSTVVKPAATFCAPDKRRLRMPSLNAWRRTASRSVSGWIKALTLSVSCMIS